MHMDDVSSREFPHNMKKGVCVFG